MLKRYITLIFLIMVTFCFFINTTIADQKNYKEILKENKKLAEENPDCFIEKAYGGVNVVWNRQNQYEVVFVYKDSPADRAGIRLGDIILSLDGIPIKNRYQAFKIYDGKYPSDVLTVKLKRRGKVFVKKVKLESHHFLYLYYVLMELINKEIPIRLAFFVQDVKSDQLNKQEMGKWKNLITSQLVGSLESIFIKNFRGQNNFIIVDRTQIESVMNEFVFQKSGLVPSELQSKLGMLGATHLFIVNLSVMKSTNTQYSTMRLIEVESGKIIASASLKTKLDNEERQIRTSNSSLQQQEKEAAAYAFVVARAKELFGIEDVTKLTPEQTNSIIRLGKQVVEWRDKIGKLNDSLEDSYKLMKQERGIRFIRSLNAEISHIKFYEFDCRAFPLIPSFIKPSSLKIQPKEERFYKQSFSKKAKCIYWEMGLEYPKPNQIIYYQIHTVYHRPNGTELFRTTYDYYTLEHWTSNWFTGGIFMKSTSFFSYGEWQIGTHRVDFYVDGVKVASETFEIY